MTVHVGDRVHVVEILGNDLIGQSTISQPTKIDKSELSICLVDLLSF